MNKSVIYLISLACLATLAAPSSGRTQTRATTKISGRALLVGVNEYQVKGVSPTPGSIEDVMATKQLIQEKGWFDDKAGEIKTLVGPQATAANIEREFREFLIKGTRPGDRVFFLYSGHGTQAPDVDGDERRSDPDDDKDEAIAPYDVDVVNRQLINIIRDDQFNDWLSKLGGRSIVMIFDSCHSGTVSRGDGIGAGGTDKLMPRYLPTPEQWQWGSQSRSMTDGGYVVSEGPRSRDLRLVVDKDRLAPNSLLAVFSAAKSHQLAYPMRTPQGGVRGAFSYFIERALNMGNPTLSQLRESVEDNIKRAQKDRRLYGHQEPDFEISAPSLMEGQPLFAAAGAPPNLPLLASGFINPASKLSLTASLGYLKNSVFLSDRKEFCFGEQISYRIRTGSQGYLYLLVFSRNDIVTLIYPGTGDKEQLDAGLQELDGFPVQEPEGKDVIVVLLTKDKLALKEQVDARAKDAPPLSWKQVFAWLGSGELEQAVGTRGQGERRKGKTLAETDWQAAVLTAEAVKSCDRLRRP
jgi:hypothetical protein